MRGTVLVTGGTGAAGGQVARWAAGRGAARVVLASRSGPGAAGAAVLAAGVAGSGARAEVLACDVADRGQVAGLLGRVAAGGPGLAAVVHAAGAGQAAVLPDVTMAGLAGVVAAGAGAAYLDELTAGAGLDAFVVFSSAAATWGGAGLGGYAAAGAFGGAVVQARRGRGLAGTSVAWGPWGGAGEDGAGWRRRGLGVLDPGLAVAALGEVLGGGEQVVTVADVDWARFAPGFTVRRPSPLLGGVPEAGAALAAAARRPGRGPRRGSVLGRRLAGLPAAEQVRVVAEVVRAEAAVVLGHSSAGAVEGGRAFKDAGFDSLMAVELRDRLVRAAGVGLPATVVFDYPTPVLLAGFVRAVLAGEQDAGAGVLAGVPAGELVAVVGVGCRFPGGAVSPELFWELLASGADAVSGFPGDRGWEEGVFDPEPGRAGRSYVGAGGFVGDVAGFDAGFFGISPREAVAMDPQQRVLLEVCWEAVEAAGVDPGSLRGSRTGVFAGAVSSGYGAGLAAGEAGHLMTGTAGSVISGRVAYALGLEGPAVTVDTACSSSLVALHLACQSLRGGECDLALAGGVTVLVTPGVFVGFSAQQGLAADGRCKAFSAAADGTGWGEGAGVVVVERLADARRNGHRVLAVVAGSAVNQDGASNGLTAPNGPSQQRVIRAALASAGLGADQVDAVEGHGTGTVLGDPIEAQALIASYGQGRDPGRPLWLGSVKSNIGHAQAAAGVAGVIKMVLALQHQVLPATLHAGEPSPHVDWSSGQVRLLAGPVPWPAAAGRPRRAGVSAFGMSGTNAHVILTSPPDPDPGAAGGGGQGADQDPGAGQGADQDPGAGGAGRVLAAGLLAWPVSARTAGGLAAQAGRLGEFVAARPDLDPADVGWSLATSRSVFEHRAVITGAGRQELAAGLAAVAAGVPAAGVVTGEAAGGGGGVVFVFPGQGGQWAGMGRDLAAASPAFAARLAECGRALAPHVDWDLGQVLAGADGAPGLDRADVVQPALWAVMVSLAAAWQAAGVTPDAVAGHSQGEIAAACVAGILSLEDAARVVALRSRALMVLAGRGGMMSVAEPAARVRERIGRWGDRLAVAAVNGPAATVVCGEPAAVAGLAAACAAAGVRATVLPVDYASHSAQVEVIREEILAGLAGITPGPAAVPMVSAMTGQPLDGPQAGAGYWYDSLRAPVDFGRAVRVLGEAGHRVFIEVSPHPVLTAAVTGTLDEAPEAGAAVVTGTLRRGDGGPARFLASLAAVHVRGPGVDWAAVLGGGRRADLPTYAFQRQRYWPPPAPAGTGDVAAAGLRAVEHPLLGAAAELAGGQGYLFTGQLSLRSQPWLADHAVAGTVLLPGTALVEMAIRAGDAAGCGHLAELTLEAPLPLPPAGPVQVQVMVGAAGEHGHRDLQVYAQPAGTAAGQPWTRHASGRLAPAAPPAAAPAQEFAVWPPDGAVPAGTEGFYPALATAGYQYGPAFRGLRAAWRRGTDIFAEVALPEPAASTAGSFGLHPALLDAALHAAGLTTPQDTTPDRPSGAGPSGAGPGAVLLPFAWTAVSLHAAGAPALRVRLRPGPAGTLSLTAADTAGAPVISVGTLALRPATPPQPGPPPGTLPDALFTVEWTPLPAPPATTPATQYAILGTSHPALTTALTDAGVDVHEYAGLPELAEAVRAGDPVPEVVLAQAGMPAGAGPAAPGGAGGAAVAARLAGRTGARAGTGVASRRTVVSGTAGRGHPGGGDGRARRRRGGSGRSGRVGAGPVGAVGEP